VPAFAFTARSSTGRSVKGLRLAPSERALAPALAAEGLFLIRAEPARGQPVFGGTRHSPGDLTQLLVHLASYLEAGLPLATALQDFRDPARPRLERAVVDMAARLGEGALLSEIMAAHPGLFRPVHVGMVQAGEAAGRLEQALRAVIRLAEWNQGLRAQVRRAAAYPLLLMAVLGTVSVLVCLFSLPPILHLLDELDIALPTVTRVFLAASRLLLRYGWMAPVLGLLLYAGAVLALRRPRLRLAWDGVLLRLPVAGRLIAGVALSRFARFLAAQYQAGIPLVQALRQCETVTGNAGIGGHIRALRLGVEQGGGLAASAARVGHFPQLVIRMLALGEETGRLDESLERVVRHFDAEVEAGVRICFLVLDPVLKLLMAAVLIFVASAVLLPLYTLIGGING